MKSIVCRNCLPEEYKNRTDLHGYWEVDRDCEIAKCNNCGFERPFHSRKRSNEIVPSQQRAIDRIKAFFDGSQYGDAPKELARFEVKTTDYGEVWVQVETTENVYTMQGGLFLVGLRGKIETKNVYDLYDNKKKRAKFYDRILK